MIEIPARNNNNTEWLKQYSGKSVDELIVILNDEKAAELARQKQEEENRSEFFKEVLAHQYFRINHNHSSVYYVKINQLSPFQGEAVKTFIQGERAEVDFEPKYGINPLWFYDKTPYSSSNTKIEKITKEDYERMLQLKETIHKLISERL